MVSRSRNIANSTPGAKRGRGQPRKYDRRTTVGLLEADILAIEQLRDGSESWEDSARRLLRAAIDAELARREGAAG